MDKNIVIIVASGKGKRMNMDIPKQFIHIKEKPIICYTIEKFQNCDLIDEIIIVTNTEYIDFFKNDIIKGYDYDKISKVVPGGKERINSVYNGINAIEDKNSLILIHDGVRPFIEDRHIADIIENTRKYKACVLGVKAKDTIKICKDNVIVGTPDRENIYLAQTPQAFEYKLIKDAYDKAMEEGFFGTDDASIVEHMGISVHMVEGSYSNIKITTQEDLRFF